MRPSELRKMEIYHYLIVSNCGCKFEVRKKKEPSLVLLSLVGPGPLLFLYSYPKPPFVTEAVGAGNLCLTSMLVLLYDAE